MIDIKVLNNKIKSLSNPTCETAILQPNKYKSIEIKLKDTAENDYSFYSGIIPEKFIKATLKQKLSQLSNSSVILL